MRIDRLASLIAGLIVVALIVGFIALASGAFNAQLAELAETAGQTIGGTR